MYFEVKMGQISPCGRVVLSVQMGRSTKFLREGGEDEQCPSITIHTHTQDPLNSEVTCRWTNFTMSFGGDRRLVSDLVVRPGSKKKEWEEATSFTIKGVKVGCGAGQGNTQQLFAGGIIRVIDRGS